MIKIAICDDMRIYREKSSQIIEKWGLRQHLNIQVREFISGEELLADVEATGYYDIVFLDIDLKGGISGIHVAMQLRKMNKYFCLIFMSQYDDYYREVFQVYPFQFLNKPLTEKSLIKVLDDAKENYWYLDETFVFHFGTKRYSILLREVLYFSSDKRVIQIYMENGEIHRFYEKLDKVEQQLKKYNNRFIRIHKSYLVNSRQIEQYHSKYIIMRNKDRLPISVEKRTEITQFHMGLLVAE